MLEFKKPRNLNPTFKLPTNYVKYLYRSVVSYNTKQIPIYPVSTIEKAAKLPVYDSIDAEVLQSYMEYSLASLIYYCMKEGATSEQSSRMTAMDNSSKNAGKI
jgi:F-type H+-transporting ATPase subunit gamma